MFLVSNPSVRKMASKFLILLLVLVQPVFAQGTWTKSAYSQQELQSFEHPDEAQVRELREQEITELRIALGRRPGTHRRADLYLRLAEIYLEAYHTEFLLEGRVHESRLSAGKKDSVIDRVHSRVYLLDGIKACKEILSFNIPYEKLDEVYYFLAFNYGELGQKKDSLRYFDKLITDYPTSSMVSEGYRQLGESAYDNRDYHKAIEYFDLAAKKSPADSLPTILHKEAWSYYRVRQYDRSVEVMKQAIAAASKQGEKFLNLKEEALRDMAVFMTEAGRAGEAIGYFQKVAGDKSFYPRLLEKLGKEYERNVEPGKATMVYESLLKTNPDSETRFRVMVKLVDLDLRRGKFKNALDRIGQIDEPSGGDAETTVAAQNLRAMVRRTATENHEHYRKTQSRPSLEIAEAFYESYLKQFLKHNDPRKETPEIQMYLAEVKRDLGKAKEASNLYREVVDSHDERYAKEAGALWTASLSDAIRKSGTNAKAQDPSSLEKEYVEAADRLQDALGDTSDGREAALKAAQVEAGYKDTQRSAIKRIKALIEKAPKSQQALTGARLWVQIYADQLATHPDISDDLHDVITDLRRNSQLISADQEIGQGKLKALLAEQEIRLKVNAIAKNEKDKNYSEAAKGYEAFANDSQQRELAEKAYSNALVNYVQARDFESEARVASSWLKRYPGSSKALEMLKSQSTQLLILGQFELAAAQFAKIGLTSDDAASLETAARIYDGVGNASAAQESWTKLIQKYPKNPSRANAILTLAKSFEAQRDDSNAGKYYKMCMAIADLEAECGARLADLYMKSEDFAQAKAMYKKVGALGGHSSHKESPSPWIGYARYQLAHKMDQDAHFDPLQLPEAKLKRALDQRTSFLEPLSKAYMNAVEAGGPWAVAALDSLAAWASHFADEIDSIAPPPKAKPEAIEKFRKQLKSLSEPLRRKAISAWNEAYTKAASAEAYSPALPDVADHLADSGAAHPGRAQGYRGKFRLAGLSADGGNDGRETALTKVRDKLLKNSQDVLAWVDYGNLLWGSGKAQLAKLSYDYALNLNPRSASAMNNRGVLALNDGEEDWANAYQGAQYFHQALKKDEFFLPAKMNLALLMNYYRLFGKAKPYWEQVKSKVQSADVEDGRAIALQGTGDAAGAEAAFKNAVSLGASETRFSGVYHRAARQSFDRAHASLAAEQCLGTLNGLSDGVLSGFEKNAAASLKRACSQWKDGN